MRRILGEAAIPALPEQDDVLVVAVAAGDPDAFAELYRRHGEAAFRVAFAVTRNRDDASDAVAEAFTRVFRILGSGTSCLAFRPYLLTTTRNAALDLLRNAGRECPIELDGRELDGIDTRQDADQPEERLLGAEVAGLVADAFAQLPDRWQSVLWLTEVEQLRPREVAELLGISANNVSQLAVRARARLLERYLQANVRNHARAGCVYTADRLGRFATKTLPERSRVRVDAHLEACDDCRSRLIELDDVGATICRAALPVPAGLWLLDKAGRFRVRRAVEAPVPPPAGGATNLHLVPVDAAPNAVTSGGLGSVVNAIAQLAPGLSPVLGDPSLVTRVLAGVTATVLAAGLSVGAWRARPNADPGPGATAPVVVDGPAEAAGPDTPAGGHAVGVATSTGAPATPAGPGASTPTTGDGAALVPPGGAQRGQPGAGAPNSSTSADSGGAGSGPAAPAVTDAHSMVANALPPADAAALATPAALSGSPLDFVVASPVTAPDGPTTNDAPALPGVPDVGLTSHVVEPSVGGALDAFVIPADAPSGGAGAGPTGGLRQGDAPAIGHGGTGIRRMADAPVVRRAGTVVSGVVAAPVVGRAGTLVPNTVAVPVVAGAGDVLGGGLASPPGVGVPASVPNPIGAPVGGVLTVVSAPARGGVGDVVPDVLSVPVTTVPVTTGAADVVPAPATTVPAVIPAPVTHAVAPVGDAMSPGAPPASGAGPGGVAPVVSKAVETDSKGVAPVASGVVDVAQEVVPAVTPVVGAAVPGLR